MSLHGDLRGNNRQIVIFSRSKEVILSPFFRETARAETGKSYNPSRARRQISDPRGDDSRGGVVLGGR